MLSNLRKEAAKKLEQAIKTNLLDLNFLDVQFAVTVTDTKHYTDRGMDEVEFVIEFPHIVAQLVNVEPCLFKG